MFLTNRTHFLSSKSSKNLKNHESFYFNEPLPYIKKNSSFNSNSQLLSQSYMTYKTNPIENFNTISVLSSVKNDSNQTGFAAFRYESKILNPNFKSNSKNGAPNFHYNSDFWINTTESINVSKISSSNKLKYDFDVDICKKRPQTTMWRFSNNLPRSSPSLIKLPKYSVLI